MKNDVVIFRHVATRHDARTAPNDPPCFYCVMDAIHADETVIACLVTVQHDSACPLSDFGSTMDSCLCEHVDLKIEVQYK